MSRTNSVNKTCQNTNAYNSCNSRGPVVYGRGQGYSSVKPSTWAWQSVSCSYCGRPRYTPAPKFSPSPKRST